MMTKALVERMKYADGQYGSPAAVAGVASRNHPGYTDLIRVRVDAALFELAPYEVVAIFSDAKADPTVRRLAQGKRERR
jgi:hypothetical protein